MADEVKITVIATGFPESGVRPGLFGGAQRQVPKKDLDVPPATVRDREEKKPIAVEKTAEKAKSKEPVRAAAPMQEEDDGWGGLPSFLRRK